MTRPSSAYLTRQPAGFVQSKIQETLPGRIVSHRISEQPQAFPDRSAALNQFVHLLHPLAPSVRPN